MEMGEVGDNLVLGYEAFKNPQKYISAALLS